MDNERQASLTVLLRTTVVSHSRCKMHTLTLLPISMATTTRSSLAELESVRLCCGGNKMDGKLTVGDWARQVALVL